MSMKKALNASIYTPYKHFQLSDFTFNDPTINNTYNVKLNKNMNLIEQTYNRHKLAFDFWAFYRDKDMLFIYKTKDLLGHPSVTSKIPKKILKTTKFPTTLDKQWSLGRYFKKTSNNEKVIVTENKWHLMSPSKRKSIVVLQDENHSKTTIWTVNPSTFYTGYIRYCNWGNNITCYANL